MRAGTRLYARDTRRIECAGQGALDMLGVLAGHDIVRDHKRVVATPNQERDKPLNQGCLAAADRAAHADTRDTALPAATAERVRIVKVHGFLQLSSQTYAQAQTGGASASAR